MAGDLSEMDALRGQPVASSSGNEDKRFRLLVAILGFFFFWYDKMRRPNFCALLASFRDVSS